LNTVILCYYIVSSNTHDSVSIHAFDGGVTQARSMPPFWGSRDFFVGGTKHKFGALVATFLLTFTYCFHSQEAPRHFCAGTGRVDRRFVMRLKYTLLHCASRNQISAGACMWRPLPCDCDATLLNDVLNTLISLPFECQKWRPVSNGRAVFPVL